MRIKKLIHVRCLDQCLAHSNDYVLALLTLLLILGATKESNDKLYDKSRFRVMNWIKENKVVCVGSRKIPLIRMVRGDLHRILEDG